MKTQVKQKFESYSPKIRKRLMALRKLIFQTAKEMDIADVDETLKWGEPSYLVKGGSTLRINWKEAEPDYLYVYFNCKTTLVETFKEVYGDLFHYEGSRAIVFHLDDEIPVAQLKHCISLSFCYHKVKHLTLLGA